MTLDSPKKTTSRSSEILEIVIDTREQTPWHFPEWLGEVSRGTLPTGDYALHGDSLLAIERKSLNDFVGSVSSDWRRFSEEIDRMLLNMIAAIVIVEGSMLDIMDHNYDHPEVKPLFICKQIAQLTLRGVCVLFADNPTLAAGMAYRILKNRKDQICKEEKAKVM